jgi:hypothetical protein
MGDSPYDRDDRAVHQHIVRAVGSHPTSWELAANYASETQFELLQKQHPDAEIVFDDIRVVELKAHASPNPGWIDGFIAVIEIVVRIITGT